MYAVGALAIAYLALYVYVTHTGRTLHPGKPIQIFRNPDAPSYSSVVPPSLRQGRLRFEPPGWSRPSTFRYAEALENVDTRA